jgi:hypothetical protein
MSKIRATLAILLATLWLPVSSHCLVMEVSSGLESLSCCTHTEAQEAAPHPEDDCATDACSVVEDAKYKHTLQQVTIPALDTHLLFELPPLLETALTFSASSPHRLDDSLARLPVAWQFSARTALPPRAPSFVS